MQSRKPTMGLFFTLVICAGLGPVSRADDLTLRTEHPGAKQFLAQPGERGILQGYAGHGLEAWIYPFQIFRNYRVSLIGEGGALTPVASLLARTTVRPESVERVYIGQDFTLVEHWFVPRERPSMLLSYSLTGSRKLRLQIAFEPVLDLMWPGGIGGQESGWDAKLNAFSIHETTEKYTAYVGSPQVLGHSDPVDYTEPWRGHRELSLTIPLSPGETPATIAVALTIRGKYDGAAEYQNIQREGAKAEEEARRDYAARLAHLVELQSPDGAANRAFRWAEIALEQAWVCNPYLGCGLVGGYGPSRDTRRPQYDWFFGGDGLIAAEGLSAAGDGERVREEFAFLRRYQDPKSGMMWHEISQSAGLLNWAQYPFQFRHVDISMDYLKTAAEVWKASADREWLEENWPSLKAAYRYVSSVRDPGSGVPLIPEGMQGHNEQRVLRDELSLSLSMLAAEQGYAVLAEAHGQQGDAEEAHKAAELLQHTIPARYWDAKTRFVYQGFTAAGKPVAQTRAPIGAIISPAFSPAQQETLVERLLQPDFLTAWGIRSTPSTDKAYDPSSYASGSVWPIANAGAAIALWEHHRASAAFSIWNAFVEATTMDAPGHIDEVISGEELRPLNVSVPEQTWSSAGFVSATISGLLGYQADGMAHVIRLAPRPLESWKHLGARLLPFGNNTLDIDVQRNGQQLTVSLVLGHPQPGAKYSVVLPDWCRQQQRAATREGEFGKDRRITVSASCGVSER